MSSFDNLPVIVVSAVNDINAEKIISELIDNEVTDTYCEKRAGGDRVWRIVNKYYTADVRLHAQTDGQLPEIDVDRVEAYIIHITEDELKMGSGVVVAERRARAAGAAWSGCDVRVLLADAARDPPALAAWAAAARADLAPLRERDDDGEGEGDGVWAEPRGWARARAALHAHTWCGLVRRGAAPQPPSPSPPPDGGTSNSSSEEEENGEDEEERAVERAEAFAAALGALGEACEARGEAGGARGEAGGARHDRAEALLLAFCRALGLDPDRC